MTGQAPRWIEPSMRAGYAARGVVYLLVGVIAVVAAWSGRQAEGPREALSGLVGETGGKVLLVLVALGLLAYAFWRLIDALLDLEAYGTGAKGVVARGAMISTALVHVALGAYAFGLIGVMGGGSSGGADAAVGRLMSWPFGRWLVIAVGAAVVGAGGYYAFGKAAGGGYRREIRRTETTERLDPALRAGFVVYGLVLAIIGGFVVWAGWTADPSEARGFSGALQAVREAPFGRWLLTGVGVGLCLFAIANVVYARHRVLPGVAGPTTQTLGGTVAEIAGSARDFGARAVPPPVVPR